jgi:hypothetical protein
VVVLIVVKVSCMANSFYSFIISYLPQPHDQKSSSFCHHNLLVPRPKSWSSSIIYSPVMCSARLFQHSVSFHLYPDSTIHLLTQSVSSSKSYVSWTKPISLRGPFLGTPPNLTNAVIGFDSFLIGCPILLDGPFLGISFSIGCPILLDKLLHKIDLDFNYPFRSAVQLL